MVIMSDHCDEIPQKLSICGRRNVTFFGVECKLESSIDSIFFWTNRRLAGGELQALKAITGSIVHCGALPMPMNRYWVQRYAAHQPTTRTIRLLQQAVDSRELSIKITRVDIALDFLAVSARQAECLREFLDYHHIMKWRGNRRVNVFRSTKYFAARSDTRNIVHYSKSFENRKTPHRFAARIEVRLSWKKALFSNSVITLVAIEKLDHKSFWARHLQLVDVDLERLGKVLSRRTRRRTPWIRGRKGYRRNEFHYRGQLAFRLSRTSGFHDPSIQDVIDRYRSRYPLLPTAFKKIDISEQLDSLDIVSQ